MARYILISSNSGYIVGDTADFSRRQSDIDGPEDAARMLDESRGSPAAAYKVITLRAAIPDSEDGYYVYRSDIDGSDQMPDIMDGTDSEMIDACERDCEFVAFVQRIPETEPHWDGYDPVTGITIDPVTGITIRPSASPLSRRLVWNGCDGGIEVPLEAFADRRLSLVQLRVLLALLSFRGKDTNIVCPKRKEISELLGVHENTISSATTALQRLGWLTKEGLGGNSRAVRYSITVPQLEAVPESGDGYRQP